MVEAQGDIRVFGGIGPRLLHGHLVKTHLFGTLTGHVFVVDGLVIEVLERKRIHVVTGTGGIHHIGFEHCIVGNSPNTYAVAG